MATDIPNIPLVLAIWKDANTGNDDVVTPENVTTYHKSTLVHTLGWLLYEDEEGVTLVNEFYDDMFRGRTFIYRPMLVQLVPYNLSRPRKAKHEKPAHSSDAGGA
jgi:hypothetical protein